MRKINTILGIESSCDDSAAAIYHAQNGVLAHTIASQIQLHTRYGGVVPELAARSHLRNLTPVIQHVLDKAKLALSDLDGIAYTRGPGLAGSLLVGSQVAHALAASLQIPIAGIHHMEGHLLSSMLESPKPSAPFLALLVSGGHTMLVHVAKIGQYKILGETLDDAAGEAFDKVAKMLGLEYPGGPQISNYALQGDSSRFKFPQPLTKTKNCNFSFSGLKTAVARQIQALGTLSLQDKYDIAACFETTITTNLVNKTRHAFEISQTQDLVVAGGVAANRAIRSALLELTQQRGGTLYAVKPEYCTDNAAMIAYCGLLRLRNQEIENSPTPIIPRWSLEDLPGVAT